MMLRRKVWNLLMIVFLVQVASTHMALAAEVVSAVTCENIKGPGNEPVGVRSDFDPQTPEIHVVVQLKDLKAGGKLKGVWLAIDAMKEANYTMSTSESVSQADGEATAQFKLSKPPSGWPMGKYKLDLYWEGNLVSSVPFSIVASSSSGTSQQKPPQIVSIVACESVGQDNAPVKTTSKFNPLSPEVNVIATVKNLRPGATAKGVWISVDAIGTKSQEIRTTEVLIEKGGEATVRFQMSKPGKGWPKGHYKMELYIDGQSIGSVPFTVEMPASSGS